MSKKEIIEYFDSLSLKRDPWRKKNSYYHNELIRLIKFLIPEGSNVIDIGSSTGELLNRLKPKRGVGIDLSSCMVEAASKKYSHLQFLIQDAEDIRLEETFDYIVIAGSIYVFTDVWKVFRSLRKISAPESRLVITYYNGLWEPLLKFAEKIKLRMPRPYQNWLAFKDISNLLCLNGYEVIKKGKKLLIPINIPILSWLFNKILAHLPLMHQFCLIEYIVARKIASEYNNRELTCSVIVPCRNEKGNIEPLLSNFPLMGAHTEIIFVDGCSTDGTVDEIKKMMTKYSGKLDIKLIHQIPPEDKTKIEENVRGDNKMLKLGKADAVRKGFASAKGDILMILDADRTVSPDDLPKFFQALAESKGEFINGTRLVYPIEKDAMRLLNIYANEFFGYIFSWLLGQNIKDTLCGTKALSSKSYQAIKSARGYFGDFDPFGDFELLFGAAKQNLKIVELPVRYYARTYGDIKIERFRHGILLLRMCILGFFRFKLI